MQSRDSRAKNCLTIRSSSEWNEITTIRPPGRRTRMAAASACSRLRELVIDRDAESLEDARRGVDAARPPRLHAGDEAAEFVRCLERRLDTATDDRSRDARRLRLFAVLGEDASKVLFSPAVHEVGRRLAKIRIGTHVERSSGTEAEAPLLVGELDGREAEVEEDSVDRSETVLAGQLVENSEVSSSEDRAIAEARELSRGDARAAGSRSSPRSRPSGALASRMAAACPPPPTVPSRYRPPSWTASWASASATRTGSWAFSISSLNPEVPEIGLDLGLDVGKLGAPASRLPDLEVVEVSDDDGFAFERRVLP